VYVLNNIVCDFAGVCEGCVEAVNWLLNIDNSDRQSFHGARFHACFMMVL